VLQVPAEASGHNPDHKPGTTQEDLAHEADITTGTLSLIERGHANPTWGTLEGIAAALGVTMGELGKLADKLDTQRRSVKTQCRFAATTRDGVRYSEHTRIENPPGGQPSGFRNSNRLTCLPDWLLQDGTASGRKGQDAAEEKQEAWH